MSVGLTQSSRGRARLGGAASLRSSASFRVSFTNSITAIAIIPAFALSGGEALV